MSEHEDFRIKVQQQVEVLLRSVPYHTLELPNGTLVPGLIPKNSLEERLDQLTVPKCLRGSTILDIGAASGWNTFECIRRGGKVTAIDCVEFREFRTVAEMHSSPPAYHVLDVDEIRADEIGTFDYVLFLGVLYHLRHPLLALETVCALTRDTAFAESYVTDSLGALDRSSRMEFFETDELRGQVDNWYGPTTNCLLAMCRAAGFARVELQYSHSNRAGVLCSRKWNDVPNASGADPSIRLFSCVSNRSNDNVFHQGKDEYICVYFRCSRPTLTIASLRFEIDDFGVPLITMKPTKPNEWQVNAKLPPGLLPGEHLASLRLEGEAALNSVCLCVLAKGVRSVAQVPTASRREMPNEAPAIELLENTFDHSCDFRGYPSERVRCRFKTAEDSVSTASLHIQIDEYCDVRPSFVTDLGDGDWECLAEVPQLPSGSHSFRIKTGGGAWSLPNMFFVESSSAESRNPESL